MNIRLLGTNDLKIFRDIRLEALRTHPEMFASSAEQWAALSDEEWRARMHIPIVAAIQGGAAVGLMGLIGEHSPHTAHRATLIMVYLRAASRGTGVAQAMLERIEQEARTQGITQIELMVSAENTPARAFYRGAGYRLCGQIPGALRHDGRLIDEVQKYKRL